MEFDNNDRLVYIVEWVAIAVNTILFVFKLIAGNMSDSIAITADAWHTISDTFTSVIVILGVYVAAQPPDKEHPFGHGRIELIASIIIGILLSVVAFNFLIESVHNLIHKETSHYDLFSLIVMSMSVIVKEAIAIWSFWAGRKTNCLSLIADGWHSRSDAIASGVVVAGIKESIDPLIGIEADDNIKKNLRDIIKNLYDKELSIHHIHLHRYGRHSELTFHIRLEPNMNLKDSHNIASIIEMKVREKMNMEATIHIEPLR